MAKGHQGQSCREAIRSMFKPGDVLAASAIHSRLQAVGSWKDETIWQHLMGLVINLPPARHHWANAEPFLFLRPDGQYELYNQKAHPKPVP